MACLWFNLLVFVSPSLVQCADVPWVLLVLSVSVEEVLEVDDHINSTGVL